MTLPVFRAAGTLAHSSTANITPAAPAGLAVNDIELLVCESMDIAIALTTANGFVEVTGSPISVPNVSATIATRGACYWRRWNGSDGDPVVTLTSDHIIAQRYAFSGCITSGDPWNFIQTSSDGFQDTTGSATGNTTSVADCLIAILVGSAKPDSTSTTELSGFTNGNLANLTERADNAASEGNGGHLGLATGELASAGASGDTTYTKVTSAYKWHFVVALKPAAGGQTIAVAQDTETDASQVVAWAPKKRLASQVSETELSQVVGKRKIYAIAQNTETELAQAISVIKNRAVTQISETDLSQAIGVVKNKLIGQVTETNLSQAIAKLKINLLVQDLETDTAQTISVIKIVSISQVNEIDLAQALGTPTIIAVAQVSETELSQAVSARKIVAIAQVSETDLSQAITKLKINLLVQDLETDTAQAISAIKIVSISQVNEIDLAQALGTPTIIPVAQVSETELSQAVSARKIAAIAQAAETDLAQPLSGQQIISITQVGEADLAQSLFPSRKVSVVQISETDFAQSLFPSKRVAIVQTIETELSQSLIVFGGGTPIIGRGEPVIASARYRIRASEREEINHG